MENIYKLSLIGGIIFAIFDAICALFAAFALQPFLVFWSFIAHVKFTGVGVESVVTPESVIGGIVFFFFLGFGLTWLCVWLHRKFCCEEK